VLFPSTYQTLSSWLRTKSAAHEVVLRNAVVHLTQLLGNDPGVVALAGENAVTVLARRKSLYSTMRKLVTDGRVREQVHDLLGLRIIITPQPGSPVRGYPSHNASVRTLSSCVRRVGLYTSLCERRLVWIEAEAPLTPDPFAGGGRNGGWRKLRRGRVLSLPRARFRHLGASACVATVPHTEHPPLHHPAGCSDARLLFARLICAVRLLGWSGAHPGKVERLSRQPQGERVPQLTLHVSSARRRVRANGARPRHRRVSDAYFVS
jgi:hypothetical protein